MAYIPTELTCDLARFIGILHGDGNTSYNRILVSDECKAYHLNMVIPLFQRIFGLEMNLFHDKNRNSYYSHKKNKQVYHFVTGSLEIPRGSVREGLFIPNYLKTAPKEVQAAYIGGIFDSEGYVSHRQAQVSFFSTNLELMEFIQKFLEQQKLKFSFVARNRSKKTEYEIHLYGRENIRLFLEHVPVYHPEKVKRLQDFCLLAKDPCSPSCKRCKLSVAYSSGMCSAGAKVISLPPGKYGRKTET